MAIKGAVRWKPNTGSTSLEATVANLQPQGPLSDPTDPASPRTGTPSGSIVMIAQLVAYDDTSFSTANTYRPGHRDTEDKLTILYQEAVTKDLSAFGSMTNAQAQAEWTASLTAFRDRVAPAGPTLVKAIRAARLAPPILIG